MNSSLVTLAVFLVAAMFLSQAQAQGQFDPKACCYGYITKPVPLRNLKSYEHGHGMCSTSAIIFVTQKNRRLCADPNEQWVQERIKQLSQK